MDLWAKKGIQSNFSRRQKRMKRNPFLLFWLLPLLMSFTLLAIGITAITSGYKGTIDLKFGTQGGSITIVGHP